MLRKTILVIDDEPGVLQLIEFNLKTNGFNVITANTGNGGLRKADSEMPDLIVLDLMLPDLDGIEVCRSLKNHPKTADIPVIILSAKTSEVDRVLGLELGAEDYLTKPFNVRELVLRIRRSIRRGAPPQESKVDRFHFGDFTIDRAAHEVKVRGRPVHLTPIEFKLLTRLAGRPEKVHTRDELLRELGDASGESTERTIDTHMRRLRAKLGAAAEHFVTVRGIGYRFVD